MHIEKMNDGFRKYIENDSIHFIDCNCLTGVCTIILLGDACERKELKLTVQFLTDNTEYLCRRIAKSFLLPVGKRD